MGVLVIAIPLYTITSIQCGSKVIIIETPVSDEKNRPRLEGLTLYLHGNNWCNTIVLSTEN